MTERLGDAPIEEQHRAMMNAIARALDEMFNGEQSAPRIKGLPDNRKTGFVLLVFPFDEIDPGGKNRCNFISNGADRRDIVALFKEMIARFEGQPEMKGSA